jgi:hypothetical protein
VNNVTLTVPGTLVGMVNRSDQSFPARRYDRLIVRAGHENSRLKRSKPSQEKQLDSLEDTCHNVYVQYSMHMKCIIHNPYILRVRSQVRVVELYDFELFVY